MFTNTVTRTCARNLNSTATRFGARSYATDPPLSHGGRNRAVIVGLVGITVPALYLFSSRNEKAYSTPLPDAGPQLAKRDPSVRVQLNKEANADGQRHTHPEHLEPERFKPAFGRVHERKRVDGPPDGRNHKDLNEQNRQI